MSTLLRIDASSRVSESHSRALADFFVNNWNQNNPDNEVITRDLATHPLPHISETTITSFYTPTEMQAPEHRQALTTSDRLIHELMTADALLIDTPMYNFSIPSALKAWVDQVVRIGATFTFTPEVGFEGLVKEKPAYVITSTGAAFSDEPMKAFDFLTPYLHTLLTFLGFSDIQFFSIEGTTTDEALCVESRKQAQAKISALFENLSTPDGEHS